MSMSLALYMDVHIPMAITEALRRKGLDILRSQDDGTTRLNDALLLQRATDLKRVLFSQDQGFLKITSEWQRQRRPFSGVVCAPQQAVSLGRLADDLELILTCCELEELQDRVVYLPLR
jgi:Domain of unknown function (DUF5615)